jgi:hypothetical protein
MTGTGSRNRHNKARKDLLQKRRDCNYKDVDGTWRPKPDFNKKGARLAIERIYDLTGMAYVRYECRNCGLYHIKIAKRTYLPQPC